MRADLRHAGHPTLPHLRRHPPAHAEAIVKAVHVAFTQAVATRAELPVTNTGLQTEIQALRSGIKAKLRAFERRVVIRITAIWVVLDSILVAALKLEADRVSGTAGLPETFVHSWLECRVPRIGL